MFGYSRIEYEVFLFPEKPVEGIEPKIKINTKLLRMADITTEQWQKVRQIQNSLGVLYLKWRYGSSRTYVLLAYCGKKLVHIEWLVPAEKIKSRYPFVSRDSYAVISCVTVEDFRGQGVYPSQLQKVVESDIYASKFWIWTATDNTPSLKGIRKVGGIKVGEFIQKKWFCGLISQIKYFAERNNCG